MKIAQIVLPGASEYERKSQRADLQALTEAGHEVGVYAEPREVRAGIAHIYGRAPFRGLRVPYVVDADLKVPEAVEEMYWPDAGRASARPDGLKAVLHGASANVVASFDRAPLRNLVQLTVARIRRTRDDVTWHLYDHPPSPAELASIAVWVDPAIEDSDYDGFVAEAMVSGVLTVAGRTPINVHRTEKGRTGILVPRNDANELTHAILAALFKSELGPARLSAAQQTIAKFRPRRRARALTALYES